MTDQKAIDASVVILTRNEERHIERAVASASAFAEVIVIDSASEDATKSLASAAGARVVDFQWNGEYPKKKEWSISSTKFDWVIYLDADEFFTPELIEELKRYLGDPAVSAIDVPLRYYWIGRELRHGHQVTKRIAMRKSRCVWPRPNDLHVANMWEVEGHYQPQVRVGTRAQTSSRLGHQDEDGLYDYFARHNRYSDWEAHMLEEGDTSSALGRSIFGRLALRLPAKPLIFFFYSYILRRGFLDGRPGFDYALALSFYYWQIGVKRFELSRPRP